ncbi:M20/M25/M40 family metallo-hydrolase [Sporosarcina sp. OR05]|uniref:M20/M25/M40 family metallo-hydrolase n=1 Tax=Sporosarcina sp. OR05 TaxID=2969819 RepID=UPI00352B7BCC
MESAPTLLSNYVQINTSTSEGNEKSGLLYMQRLADSFGLYTYFHETAPSKGNLIIALREEDLQPFYDEVFFYDNQRKGTPFPQKPMVLLSHVDVVDANPDGWIYPPFSGKIVDDFIWGRGTIDAKQIGIVHLMTMKKLRGTKTSLSIVQVITSEEEYGSENGLKRLLRDYPFLWKDAIVWNEGGGFPIEVGGTFFYLVETGQKGNMSFTLTIPRKPSGNPYLPSNEAELSAFRIAQSVAALQVPQEQMQPSVSTMFELMERKLGISSKTEGFEELFDLIPEKYNRMFSAMVKTTFTVTSICGGKQVKESNGAYTISVDVRPLPDTDLATVKNLVEQKVKSIQPSALINWHAMNAGYDQTLDEKLRLLLQEKLEKSGVEAVVVPFMTIGSNDGKYFKEKHAEVLGYCPMTSEMTFDKVLPLVHGMDERISIKDLEFGISQMVEIMESLIERYTEGEIAYERQ